MLETPEVSKYLFIIMHLFTQIARAVLFVEESVR